jgi:hypothetical protein
MNSATSHLLTANGAFLILFSSLFGVLMLIPFQPWGRQWKARINGKAMLAAHLDWIMMAFMQWGAVHTIGIWPPAHPMLVAWLLIAGSWINPLPYVFRGFGINAFSLSGSALQKSAASLGALSSIAIIAAWLMICIDIIW